MKRMTRSGLDSVVGCSLPNRQSDLTSPKKLPFPGPALSDEENALNGNHERGLKRAKTGSSRRSLGDIHVSSATESHKMSESPFRSNSANEVHECPVLESLGSDVGSEVSVARLTGWLNDFGKENRNHYERTNPGLQKSSSTDSDCESDVSVAKLSGWLDDFGKQHKQHYDRVNHTGKAPDGVFLAKPIRPKANSSMTPVVKSAKSSIKPNTIDAAMVAAESRKGPMKTPVRFKPRYRKEDVRATDDGYASVKKLSAWLADDPTSAKKVCTVRRGMNVIAKSRQFEKDLANVVIEESNIVKGNVSHQTKRLQKALFEEDDAQGETTTQPNVTDKKKWLENAFHKSGNDDDDTEYEGSSKAMTVSEKKQRLQNAFKKEKEMSHSRQPTEASYVGRDASEAPTPRLERSEKHLPVERSPYDKPKTSSGSLPISAAPPATKLERSADESDDIVDFKAARQLLLQRSAENGNPVRVLTKVDTKKKQFERLTKENRRKSAAHGLLKPTWENADPTTGPSTSYTKSFVSDVAPKKSFEELP